VSRGGCRRRSRLGKSAIAAPTLDVLETYSQMLQLDRRQKYKRDARASTNQREQYRGTVHLFIGTGRSPVKITFMSFTTSYNHDTNYYGSIGLFLFKSVQPFVSRHVAMPKLPRW
jgi:dienelactone hydrolase